MMTQLPTVTRTYCTSIYETNFLSESPIPILRILAVLRGAAASNKPAMAPLVAVRNFVPCFTRCRWPQPPDDDERDAATDDGRTRSDAEEGQGGWEERGRDERGAAQTVRRRDGRECTIQFERRPCSARSSISFILLRTADLRKCFARRPRPDRPTDHDREAHHDHDHARPARKRKPN